MEWIAVKAVDTVQMSAGVPIAMGDVEMGVMLGIKVQSVKYVSTCVSYAVNQI